MDWLRRAVDPLRRALLGLLGHRATVEGFDVLVGMLKPEEEELVLARLRSGLLFLAEKDERALRRLRRHVRRFVLLPSIWAFGYNSFCGDLQFDNSMMLFRELGPSPGPEVLSLVVGQFLVGAAMQARLLDGVPHPLDPERQDRVTRLALRARLVFARQQGLEELAEHFEEELADERAQVMSGAQTRDAVVERLRAVGAPEFMIRFAKRLFAKRVRRDLN